jgi:UTP--glucose-1-phosphate uridylyltransferase
MNIKKVVITAAGRNQHTLPLQTLVDRDGAQKTALRIIIEEAISAGIEDFCIVICPGDQSAYKGAAGKVPGRLEFVEQSEPRGYGDALYCAKEFLAGESFLHMVSDHLYLTRKDQRCAQQLTEIARQQECSISAVQSTREAMLPYYGTIGGKTVSHEQKLYSVETVIEKPTPTEAEQKLIMPGLRSGHYLCFFGMHVLTPAVIEILGEKLAQARGKSSVPLSAALASLPERERYLAFEVSGRRYNLGEKFGQLTAQLAFGLAGRDREEVLAQLSDVLASRLGDAEQCQAN